MLVRANINCEKRLQTYNSNKSLTNLLFLSSADRKDWNMRKDGNMGYDGPGWSYGDMWLGRRDYSYMLSAVLAIVIYGALRVGSSVIDLLFIDRAMAFG